MMSSANSKQSKGIVRTIKVVIFLTILSVVVFWPVWKVIQFFQPNSRMYFKGCITASANLNGSDAKYVNLEIGRAGYEYAGNPKFEIRLRDGTILTFPKADMSEIIRLSDSDREAARFRDTHPLAREYSLPECSITINEQRVIRVNLSGFDNYSSILIRTDRTKDWRAMPMSDEDLIDLFGEASWMKDDWRE